ncbi:MULTISPECIES: hypothetical protein [unclassified Exiguobacterium]|uniref:hypothetical protein n=1 Tax=unclassified Exiguobacterium TaxID=2644629 RepID=UPI00103B3E33|nr:MULTISPECIES: hypothetical protein [unclassified Exiguobacterium]TCI32972.1 hypothetical protein EVJ29_15010 [Exiguobacterium sp. SH4S7]TCI42788.1 hypothetical protein EVJ31_13535 [Exiguobacterium sp. SH5S32]TCI50199.1 hypothetical protein EVJ25_12625 [Exiguobacterium sp. SH1S4]TCI60494.1 hypothetical protein EVJ21_10990 [Exiguobacterium sp. SH0S2]TCI67512.1 hypothetical protein EVJ23_13525 [Exiguobacterium sp. SH1S1]
MGKLWLVEGLPGSGKTTFAERLAVAIPRAKFYSESDESHPVDVHAVNWVKSFDYANGEVIDQDDGGVFVRFGSEEEVLGTDVYELPFEQHVTLMLGRWKRFVELAQQHDTSYIFECVLLQNPFTIGMVAQDVSNEQIESYIMKVADLIKPLEPTVIYLETEDVPTVFSNVFAERSEQWKQGFVDYYTSQTYGTNRELSNIEGTIEILLERQHRELNLLNQLPSRTIRIVNDDRRSFDILKTLTEKGGR